MKSLYAGLGALVGLLGAAGCSPDVNQPQAEEGADKIECALGDGSEFGPDCLVERSEIEGKTVLTVRHPDGGFRRFEQLKDGSGIAEMDGADTATRTLDGDILLVSVGADRYRFKVAVREADEKPQ